MNHDQLQEIARQLLGGDMSVDQFATRFASGDPDTGISNLGDAQIDLDRHRRCGFPEVVYSQGKTNEALERIFQSMLDHGVEVFATRMSQEQADYIVPLFPDGQYNQIGRTFRIEQPDREPPAAAGRVAVVTAGTSDMPVAEEARETLLWTGTEVTMVHDVGVAGPHRLKANLPLLRGSDAVVVVAGMEGALPSVVGGHVDCPIIAVPTSVGYGASLGGIAALLGMLNSCASNVTVVNIDAGFKGGYVAGLIAKNARRGS